MAGSECSQEIVGDEPEKTGQVQIAEDFKAKQGAGLNVVGPQITETL